MLFVFFHQRSLGATLNQKGGAKWKGGGWFLSLRLVVDPPAQQPQASGVTATLALA